MAAYVIADVQVTDDALFAKYRDRAPAVVTAHGGKYLSRYGALEVIQGDWAPKGVVVMEFDSVEQVREWQSSPDYAELKELLNKSSNANLIVVEGV